VASRPGQKLDGVKDALPPGLAMNPATVRDETRNGVEVRTFLITNQVGERAMFYLLPGLDVRISASEIREGIREDLHASMRTEMENASRELVPRGVAEYVLAHGLYR